MPAPQDGLAAELAERIRSLESPSAVFAGWGFYEVDRAARLVRDVVPRRPRHLKALGTTQSEITVPVFDEAHRTMAGALSKAKAVCLGRPLDLASLETLSSLRVRATSLSCFYKMPWGSTVSAGELVFPIYANL